MEIMKIAENLKKLREDHALTQEALAESLGISAIAVYMWEAGRLPLEYKTLEAIAEYFGTPVETITGAAKSKKSKSNAADLVSFKCKICGGDLDYNYLSCTCRCANCGNKWAIAELYPKYAHAIRTINRASEILENRTEPAAADEAKLLFGQAITECSKFNDAVSTELIKICKEGQAKTKQLEIYCRGKYFFDHKSYKSALKELEKVAGFKDADEMIKRCKKR